MNILRWVEASIRGGCIGGKVEVCRVEPLLMARGTSGQPTDGGQKPCEFVSSASLQAKGGRTEGKGRDGV